MHELALFDSVAKPLISESLPEKKVIYVNHLLGNIAKEMLEALEKLFGFASYKSHKYFHRRGCKIKF